MRHGLLSAVSFVLISTGVVIACGGEGRRSGFEPDKTNEDGSIAPPIGGGGECTGLACQRAECGGGVTTTLSGKVYDPAGANPLYNVQVYIPTGDLEPIASSLTDGIKCETCDSKIINPLVGTITDAKGEFTLENVPVGKDIPVVIQVGKWRRQFHVNIDKKCEQNEVDDRDFKLPKNGTEGDMPHIAVTSGGYDALECLLRGVGVDDDEFVMGDDPSGHVHVYKGSGGGMGVDASKLWNDAEQLKKFDMVLMSCEGQEALDNKGGTKPGARGSMYEYLNAGGRAFGSHYQYTWFKLSPESELKNLATWGRDSTSTSQPYDINMSFPKGEKMAEWLLETGASSTLGKIELEGVTNSVGDLRDPAISWVGKNGTKAAKFFTVNTPISAPVEQQCGRAVFADLHLNDGEAGPPKISQCPVSAGGLSDQMKVLEFIFYDLSACVQDDQVPPDGPN